LSGLLLFIEVLEKRPVIKIFEYGFHESTAFMKTETNELPDETAYGRGEAIASVRIQEHPYETI
jgi:hypothetical protein